MKPAPSMPHFASAASGGWIDLLDDPDELEARAVWLRTDEEHGWDNSLEDLIARLSEFVDDPDRLEARAVALRAAGAATEGAFKRVGPRVRVGVGQLSHGCGHGYVLWCGVAG